MGRHECLRQLRWSTAFAQGPMALRDGMVSVKAEVDPAHKTIYEVGFRRGLISLRTNCSFNRWIDMPHANIVDIGNCANGRRTI